MATMEQAFEMVENLTEELSEKEDRIMALERRLAEEEEENKKLFDFKEIVDLCGSDIFNSIDSVNNHAMELEDMISDTLADNIARRWGREVDEKTEDGLILSVYHKLMPQAIEFLHTQTNFSVPFYVKKEPLEPYKNFQSQAFLTLKELSEKIIEVRNDIYETQLEDDDKTYWDTEKLFSLDIEETMMGVDEDTFDNRNDWMEFLDKIQHYSPVRGGFRLRGEDYEEYCIVNCSFKRNGEDMYMLQS